MIDVFSMQDVPTKHDIDVLHAKIVILNGNRCVTCGETNRQIFNCGHIFSRKDTSTRWDIHPLGNCHVQCHFCNGLHEDIPFYDSPFVKWYKDKFGDENFRLLEIRHNQEFDLSNGQLRAIYNSLLCTYEDTLKRKYPFMIIGSQENEQ